MKRRVTALLISTAVTAAVLTAIASSPTFAADVGSAAASSTPQPCVPGTSTPLPCTPSPTSGTTPTPTPTRSPDPCEPKAPEGAPVSATATSLTFSFTYANACRVPSTTRVSVATERGSYSLSGTASGSGSSGTLTVTGLTPGTWYYYFFTESTLNRNGAWLGPVATLLDDGSTPPPPTCDPPAEGGPAMTKLPLPAGYTLDSVNAINDAGVVVGNASAPDGRRHAVKWDPEGAFADLGTLPGGSRSGAVDINRSGTVAGTAETAGGVTHAVRWKPSGVLTDLGTLPGGGGSTVIGIGDDGTVVGNAVDGAGRDRAVKWDRAGRIADLGTLGGDTSSALVHNDIGMVAGFAGSAEQPDYPNPVLWTSDGVITDIRANPKVPWFQPTAINNSGTVLGASDSILTWDTRHGLRVMPEPPGSYGSYAIAINDAGTVVGGTWMESPGSGMGTPSRLVRWDRYGRVRYLPSLPGRERYFAGAINDSGVIIGLVHLKNLVPHAVRWDSRGAIIDLGGVSSCDTSRANAVNDTGTIAGSITLDGTTAKIPVVWRESRTTR